MNKKNTVMGKIACIMLTGSLLCGCQTAVKQTTQEEFIKMAADHLYEKYGDINYQFDYFTGKSFMGSGTNYITYDTSYKDEEMTFTVTFIEDDEESTGYTIRDSYFPITILADFDEKATAAADKYFTDYKLYVSPVISLYNYADHQDLDKNSTFEDWLSTDRKLGSGSPSEYDLVISNASMDQTAFDKASASMMAEWAAFDEQSAPRIVLIEDFVYKYVDNSNVNNVYMKKNCIEVYGEEKDTLLDDTRETPTEYTGTELNVCLKENMPIINILQTNEQAAHFKHIMSILNYLKDKYGKEFFYENILNDDTEYYYDGMQMNIYAVDDPARAEFTAACKLLPSSSDIECTDTYSE